MPDSGAERVKKKLSLEIGCANCSHFRKFEKQMPWTFLVLHGWRYAGPHFTYCPFCGHILDMVEPEE